MELVKLGKVVKLHGYIGQMKIATSFDKDFDIKQITKLYDVDKNEFNVTRIFANTDSVVVSLENVDLEKAKSFVGRDFYISRDLVKDKILIEDLKKSCVKFEDGTILGKINDVQDYGTAEVFYCMQENGKELLFPNVKGVIVSFDYKEKVLVVSKEKLKEVSDYEDWYINTFSKYVWTTKREYNWKSNKK